MNCLVYQVYVGPRSKLYDFCTASVEAYCEAHGFDYIRQDEPILRIRPNPTTSGRSAEAVDRLGYLPIFEKENALEFLWDYDRVAIIDADVWIRPGSPDIFEEVEGVEFAACVEREMPLTDRYRDKIRSYSDKLFGPLADVEWDWNDHGADFMNMGVMVMDSSLREQLQGQDPRQFLSRPEFQRFVDGEGAWKWSTDQVLLNWWLRRARANWRPLPWVWNCFYGSTVPGSAQRSHAVHFFLRDHLPEKGENIEELIECL